MNIKIFTLSCVLVLSLGAFAQDAAKPESSGDKPGGKSMPASGGVMEGRRQYSLIVNEGDSSRVHEYNRGLQLGRELNSRGLLSEITELYRSTFAGKAVSATSGLIDLGVTAIKNAASSKRPKWMAAVRNESSFVKVLPMKQEILDFYRAPSTVGPLDPSDMLFDGFGCRQVIVCKNSRNEEVKEEVFYLSCKVRTDTIGISRMLNHSKFEVYVDTLRFNPSLCDLPNDSLGMETENRIDFSFDKRQNLKFNVKATITSSWINQAMQVYNDQYLGEFNITASINPKLMNDGVFTYVNDIDSSSEKDVKVTGDCFLIPRSYVGATQIDAGSGDGNPVQDSWGTGQYKVEIQVSETCDINSQYYMNDGKWDKDKWEPEWEKIKKRQPSKTPWSRMSSVVESEYKDNKWIVTLLEPIKTAVIQSEGRLLNASGSSASAAQGASR